MTKKLEDLFELPVEDAEQDTQIDSPDLQVPIVAETTREAMATLEKIEEALPRVKGLEATDAELDELASLAKESYTNLMDLGFNVDSRFASEIFSAAGTMLGHAISSKTAKINKKLKTLDLQLKQAALEQKMMAKEKQLEATPVGQGGVLDRTELLKALLAKSNAKDK